MIAPDESSQREHRVGTDQACPGRRNVKGLNLRALISRAYNFSVGIKPAIVDHNPVPGSCILRVESVRCLEPGTCVFEVDMDRVRGGKLVIDSVKQIFFVALVVHHNKLRRIKESPAVQAACRNKVSPALPAIGQIEVYVRRSE